MTDLAMADPKPAKRNGRGKDKPLTKRLRLEKRAVEMLIKGDSNSAIARSVGCNEITIRRIKAKWQPVFNSLKDLGDYDLIGKDILKASEFELLKNMMSKDKLDKASVNNLAYAFTQLHQARRLESGQATTISQSVNVALSGKLAEFSRSHSIDPIEIVQPEPFIEVNSEQISTEKSSSREVTEKTTTDKLNE